MKPFVQPVGKTVYGRIINAKLNKSESEVRIYILNYFRSTGKAPSLKNMATSLPNMTVFKAMSILEKLAINDILHIKDNKIQLSYPFSHEPTPFKVEFKTDNTHCYALCSTDALGIPFMFKEDVIIHTKCKECKGDIVIDIENLEVKNIEPDSVVEFAAFPIKDEESFQNFYPYLNFFCSEEHANMWAQKNREHADGEIYTVDEGLAHGREIYQDLLLPL